MNKGTRGLILGGRARSMVLGESSKHGRILQEAQGHGRESPLLWEHSNVLWAHSEP